MEKTTTKRKRRVLPSEKRRTEILKAAAVVFSEKGYHKTRISDIAARANMGHGTVYRFFPNKRELAMQVVSARGAAGFLRTTAEQASGDNQDPQELFSAIGDSYLGNMRERLPVVRFSIAEALSDKGLAKRYYDNLLQPLFAGLTEVMIKFQKEGRLKDHDPFLLGHIFYSMLFGYMYAQELLYGKEKTHLKKDAFVAEVVDIFLHGVLQEDQ